MKLNYFSVHVAYDGSLSGSISFTGSPTSVIHTLTPTQANQLSTLIDQWKADLLLNASDALLQARDDLKALDHVQRTDPGDLDKLLDL